MSKINSYLPKVLRDIIEFQIVNSDLDVELGLLENYIKGINTETIVQTASIYGIEKWEKILGIIPDDTDSLETRRFRINNILTSKLPYTVRWLQKKLSEITGSTTGWTLNINNNDYTITIILSGLDTDLMLEVEKQLRNAIPANMVLEIGGPGISSSEIKVAIAMMYGTKYNTNSKYSIEGIFGNLIKELVNGTINKENGTIDYKTYPTRSKVTKNILNVIPGKTYYFENNQNMNIDRIAYYENDDENSFISRTDSLGIKEFTVPDGIKYIRFNVWGTEKQIANLDDSSCIFKMKEE